MTSISQPTQSTTVKQSKFAKEESMLKSYNETFYTSLKTLKFLSNPLPKEEKLIYHFEQNENASVSTTTGQLESTLDELIIKNQQIKDIMKQLREEIKQLKVDIADMNEDLSEYEPSIKILKDTLKDFIEKQRVEVFRIKEEISLLEKEKTEIQQAIYDALGYLHRLEKIVGIKSKTYTYYYDQTMSEGELSNKFLIQTENI